MSVRCDCTRAFIQGPQLTARPPRATSTRPFADTGAQDTLACASCLYDVRSSRSLRLHQILCCLLSAVHAVGHADAIECVARNEQAEMAT